MQVFKKQILNVVHSRNYSPMKLSAIGRIIGVKDDSWGDFRAAFEQLRKAGRVVIGPKNLVTLPAMAGQVAGTFRANAKGFGFIIPHQANAYGDLFVAPSDTANAMTGDSVVAKVVKRGRNRQSGVIVEILERAKSQIVGTVQEGLNGWFVRPEGKGYLPDIAVDDLTAKNAEAGDKVVVEIVSYPTAGRAGRGVIIEALGKTGRYETEIRAIMARYELPERFEPESIRQAKLAAEGFEPDNTAGRDDITDGLVITIDPADAKDFDDAISLKRNKEGNWLLGVHIADVSRFVPPGSPLDTEAANRGNSVYLSGRVVPMLPEILSNGICSLQPNQKRLAKSAYITYDSNGNVLDRDFADSVIKSSARLTYQQADRILKGDAGGVDGRVVAILKDMETLARTIEKRRIKNGMIQLELPETELILDDSGSVVDAEPADTGYPHTIIEMFMVEANEAVAALLDRFNVPFMRRIHPDPDPASIKNLSRFMKICGLKIPRYLDRAAIQDILAAVKSKSCSYAVNTYILRSLQRAEYAPLHMGHFALASKHYCHFTSPIRRYADLLVHRLLQCYIDRRLNMIGLEEVLPDSELLEIGRHITFTEQQAAEAERELKTVLILQMLSARIGSELDCVVSGLTNFGIFVQCTKFGIEGLVELKDLGPDEWGFNEKTQSVNAKRSGKSIHLGQALRVRIVSVNLAARQLSVAPSELPAAGRSRKKKAVAAGI